jgi:hypothetical protein
LQTDTKPLKKTEKPIKFLENLKKAVFSYEKKTIFTYDFSFFIEKKTQIIHKNTPENL